MKHGGDLLTYENEYDGEIVDFSSNINPLGFPDGLKEFIMAGLAELESYPDIKYRKLKQSISKYLGCGIDNIVVGNGAVEIIDNFIILADRVIIMTPSFCEYEDRAIAHGKKVEVIKYKEDFELNIKKIEEVMGDGDLLVLGNPNNPTGRRISEDDLRELYDLVIKNNAFLLLDEAFYEFCPHDYDSIAIFEQVKYKNVGIIRAATKFFALPGIRLGYGCTSRDVVETIEKYQLPWNVNTLADRSGQFIFEQEDYIRKSRTYMDSERKFIMNELNKIEGILPYNTHTNYVLIKLLDWCEEEIFQHFLKYGILIRKCSSFKGLDGEYIRIAIKDRENNRRLIATFQSLSRVEENKWKKELL